MLSAPFSGVHTAWAPIGVVGCLHKQPMRLRLIYNHARKMRFPLWVLDCIPWDPAITCKNDVIYHQPKWFSQFPVFFTGSRLNKLESLSSILSLCILYECHMDIKRAMLYQTSDQSSLDSVPDSRTTKLFGSYLMTFQRWASLVGCWWGTRMFSCSACSRKAPLLFCVQWM